MRDKYAVFLPELACRSDLNRLIQWMWGELAVGHHRVGGGDQLGKPKRVSGGLLGADYVIVYGRYGLAKVYGGLNWNPDLESPLKQPGIDVQAGEYLLAVNGQELRPPENLFSRFENTAGKIVEITVGPRPDGSGARTLQVVPIKEKSDLRNRDWVEGNIRKVDAATGGRVAYVYVPLPRDWGIPISGATFSPTLTRRRSLSTSASMAEARRPTTTLTTSGARTFATGRCAMARTWSLPAALSLARRWCSSMKMRAQGEISCRGCSANWHSDRWWASAPGEAMWESSAFRCSWTAATSLRLT